MKDDRMNHLCKTVEAHETHLLQIARTITQSVHRTDDDDTVNKDIPILKLHIPFSHTWPYLSLISKTVSAVFCSADVL